MWRVKILHLHPNLESPGLIFLVKRVVHELVGSVRERENMALTRVENVNKVIPSTDHSRVIQHLFTGLFGPNLQILLGLAGIYCYTALSKEIPGGISSQRHNWGLVNFIDFVYDIRQFKASW